MDVRLSWLGVGQSRAGIEGAWGEVKIVPTSEWYVRVCFLRTRLAGPWSGVYRCLSISSLNGLGAGQITRVVSHLLAAMRLPKRCGLPQRILVFQDPARQ